jgi:hypothetical protein
MFFLFVLLCLCRFFFASFFWPMLGFFCGGFFAVVFCASVDLPAINLPSQGVVTAQHAGVEPATDSAGAGVFHFVYFLYMFEDFVFFKTL